VSLGFETALSGLTAARTALATIGHNLTNSATPGYSRQRVSIAPVQPDVLRPGLAIGRGVAVTSVDRVVDSFVVSRLREQRGELSRAEIRRDLYGALEASFGEPSDNGVNAAFAAFFDEVRGFAFQPGDASAQSGVLQRAVDLSRALRTVRQNLLGVRRDAADAVEREVADTNRLLGEVARFNAAVGLSGFGADLPPDLQDQAEATLSELATHIDVRATFSPTGRLIVLSGGVTLVDANGVRKLEAVRGAAPTDPTAVRVAGTTTAFSPRAGALRGALDLDVDLVDERLKTVDAIAKSLIGKINHAHATGVPTDGGYRLLTSERRFVDTDGDGDPRNELLRDQNLPFEIDRGFLTVTVLDESDGTTRQSRIPVDGETTTVGQLIAGLDGVPGVNAVIDGSGRLRLTADQGLRFDFSNRVNNRPDLTGAFGVQVAAGGRYTGSSDQSFVLTPLGAGDIGVTPGLQIQVALADGTVLGHLDVGQGYAPGDDLALADGITVSFGGGTIDPSTAGPVTIDGIADGDASGVLTALGVNGIFTGSTAEDVDVSRDLIDRPAGLAAGLGGGGADAANLVRILAAEDSPDEDLEGLDAAGRYELLVTESGFESARALDASEVQSSLVEALETRRARTSGVNVDEELIRLEEWQSAFEAAARFARTLAEVSDLIVSLGQ
jgi:flagellar hook-associated protein 1 FlgK